jgi:coenzyme F420 hydrogenase subunit beta
MVSKPQVISQVVDNDLCIGCGLCTYKCPSDALSMKFNADGFLVPELVGSCDSGGGCIDVCPFNPKPLEVVKDETAIADIFLSDGTEKHDRLGRLIGVYAAHSNEHRKTSSSGGIATFILGKLLNSDAVDHVFSVRSLAGSDSHYQYMVASNKQELISSAKTKYYPVTLATVLPELEKLEGKVAIVGVACFVKAIRLAQYHDSALKEKIPFIVGIICGGIKSAFFTEYLASRAGVQVNNIEDPKYRIKDVDSSASDYAFGCTDSAINQSKKIRMKEVGDMWGTGLFKANACDFCDDVVTELADISLGDAWLEPYSNEGKGTSVIITRTPLAEMLIQKGIATSELEAEVISIETMRASQQGSYNHRHEGLYVRLKEAERANISVPLKRYGQKNVPFDVYIVQKLRRLTRKKSLELWRRNPQAIYFDLKMGRNLFYLKIATKLTQKKRNVITRLKGLIK